MTAHNSETVTTTKTTAVSEPPGDAHFSLEAVSSFLRTWLRGANTTVPAPDSSPKVGWYDEVPRQDEFPLTAAEHALKEHEKINHPLSTKFEKGLVQLH